MLIPHMYTVNALFFLSLKIIFANLNKIWKYIDGCAEQYRCAIALYLLSTFSYAYNLIIDSGVG